MSGSVAILTPDRASEGHYSRWRDVLERSAEPLRRAGLSVAGRSWTEATDLADFDLVLPLLAWGYPFAPGQWIEAVGRWEADGVHLHNPASVLRWNHDKLYLGRLAQRGAPVIPTVYVGQVDELALRQAAERLGTERLVAKPRVSASAWQTVRWSPGERLKDGPVGAAMVQPYLQGIERSGETSLIYVGRRFSHAIRKLPQPGDFRVQPEYDGIITAVEPAPEEVQAAERILAAVNESLLYARVDLVRGPGGEPLLIELELIEPDLYLSFCPGAGDRFTQAVKELMRS